MLSKEDIQDSNLLPHYNHQMNKKNELYMIWENLNHIIKRKGRDLKNFI